MADKNSDKQLASEQSREEPGNVGIPRSDMNASKRGVKRKLEITTVYVIETIQWNILI